MAGKDNKPPPKETRRERELRILTTPPSAAVIESVSPKARDNAAATEAALQLLGKPPSPEVLKLLTEQDTEFQRFAKSLLDPKRIKPEDTLDPGESLESETPEQLLRRPALTELQILLADPSDATLSALRVGILSNKDGSDKLYLAGKPLDSYLMRGGVPAVSNFSMTSLGEAQRSIANKYLGVVAEIDPGKLHPKLVERMSKDPEVAMYANYAMDAARRAGINEIMHVNQMWKESRFNPDAVSGAGARGISQIMPFHQGKWGLMDTDDFFDPYKSINAGVIRMAELTDRYKDQRLGVVAFNGGEGTIEFVQKKLGKSQITYPEWYGFMENRRSTAPTNDPSAWQNETFNYAREIIGPPTKGGEKPAPVPR